MPGIMLLGIEYESSGGGAADGSPEPPMSLLIQFIVSTLSDKPPASFGCLARSAAARPCTDPMTSRPSAATSNASGTGTQRRPRSRVPGTGLPFFIRTARISRSFHDRFR